MNIRHWMYSHTSHQIDCCRAVAVEGFLSRRWRDDAAESLIRSRKGNDLFLRGFLSVSDWEDKRAVDILHVDSCLASASFMGIICRTKTRTVNTRQRPGEARGRSQSSCLLQYSQYSTTGTMFTTVCFRGRRRLRETSN